MAGPCAARAVQAHLAVASCEAPVEAPLAGVTLGEPCVFRALHRVGFGVICCLGSIHARIVPQELPSLVDPRGERDLRIDILPVWAGLQEDSATPAWCPGPERPQPTGRRGEGERGKRERNHLGGACPSSLRTKSQPSPSFRKLDETCTPFARGVSVLPPSCRRSGSASRTSRGRPACVSRG